jgi:hypothetical protein
VAGLVTVAALDIVGVARLIAILGHVLLGVAVVAGALGDFGALILLATVFQEGASCVGPEVQQHHKVVREMIIMHPT